MKVKVIAVDDQDRVKLSRQRAHEELGMPDEMASVGGGGGREGEAAKVAVTAATGRYRDRPRRRDGGGRGGDRGGRGGGGGGRGG